MYPPIMESYQWLFRALFRWNSTNSSGSYGCYSTDLSTSIFQFNIREEVLYATTFLPVPAALLLRSAPKVSGRHRRRKALRRKSVASARLTAGVSRPNSIIAETTAFGFPTNKASLPQLLTHWNGVRRVHFELCVRTSQSGHRAPQARKESSLLILFFSRREDRKSITGLPWSSPMVRSQDTPCLSFRSEKVSKSNCSPPLPEVSQLFF